MSFVALARLWKPERSSKVGKRHNTALANPKHRYTGSELAGSLVVGMSCAASYAENLGSLRDRDRD